MKRVAACVGAILAAFAVVYLPYRIAGDPVVAGDYTHHAVAVSDFRAALADGARYPGWSASVNHGFGAATFYFYPPLPYYAAAACVAATGDLAHGLRLAAALVAALGAAGVAALVGAATRDRRSALAPAVAALGYAVLPYALYAAYYRFAWAEYCALQALPWFAWGARDLIERGGRGAIARTVAGAAAVAGCHLLTAVVVAPATAIAFVAAAIRRRAPSIAVRGAAAATLALLVIGAFIVPVVRDADTVDLAHTQRTEACRYAANFLFDDEVRRGHPRAASKSTMEWIVVLEVALLVVAFAAVRRVRRRDADAARLAAGLALALGTTVVAEPVWRALPPLAMLQFPARLIGPLGLLAVWSAGIAFAHAGRGGRLAVGAALGACAIGSGLVVAATLPSDRPAAPPIDPSRFVLREYAPAATDDDLLVDAWRAYGARAVAVDGAAEIERLSRTPHESAWRVTVAGDADATVWLPRFTHPGWTLAIDDRPTPSVPNALGLLACAVPPGVHTVTARHESAPSRVLGWWVTLGGLVLVGLWLVRAAPPHASEATPPLLSPWLAIGVIAAAALALGAYRTCAPPQPLPPHVVALLVDAPPGPSPDGFFRFPAPASPEPADAWRDAISTAAPIGARVATLDGLEAARAWLRQVDDEPIALTVGLGRADASRIDTLLQTLEITYRRIDATILIRWADGTCDVDPTGAQLTDPRPDRAALGTATFVRALRDRTNGPDRSPDRMFRTWCSPTGR